MRRPVQSDLIIRLCACLFTLAIAVICVALFVSDIRASSIVDSAARVELGARINDAALPRLDENRALRRAEKSCRHIGAAVTIRSQAVDQMDDLTDPTNRDAAVDALERAIARALSCTPLEGRYWLALAQVRLQQTGPVSTVLDALHTARATRAAESGALIDRLVVMAWLHDAGIDATEGLLRSDIAIGLRHLDLQVLAELYVGAGEQTRQIYRRELMLIPEDRRSGIEERIVQLHGELTRLH